jgi:hypothetical protein
VILTLFVWVVDDSLEMSERGLCKRQKGTDRRRERWKGGKKRLVWLIAVIVDRSVAHPSDLAEFLALVSSEYFKCRSIRIDISVVVVVLSIIGLLRIGMKRGAI